MSVAKIVGKSLVDGAQNIRGVWRIYLKDRPARFNLCVRRYININPLSPHDALKHHFTSLKTDLQPRVLE